MKEWFKARNTWGAAIETLTDDEAGRLMKALWRYTMTGEHLSLSGAERGIFALILMTLSQDEERDSEISGKRASAGSIGGKQKVANASKPKQNVANATNDVANQAIATIRIKNKNKEQEQETEPETEKESERKGTGRFAPPTIAQVIEYCQERGNKVDPQRFVDYYCANGWKVGKNPMKDWRAAVRTWERDSGTAPAKPAKTVTAQQYEQRDYSGQDDDLLSVMAILQGDMRQGGDAG